MAHAIVDLKWAPGDFWASTPHEFWSAFELIIERAKE